MNQTDSKPMNGTQTPARKILDFLVGFLGNLFAANIGLLLFAQFDPQRLWIPYFKWVWIVIVAGLAVFLYIRKRNWISIGIAAAILLQAL